MCTRREQAYNLRVESADVARQRPHPEHISNGEETRYTDPCDNLTHIASYTKGLPHDRETGLLADPSHFELFVDAINSADPDHFKQIPLGPQTTPRSMRFRSGIASRNDNFRFADVRAWESIGAGHAFDLEGPDAQAVTMPPAPTLDSDELATEVTELYWMALLRDLHFSDFDNNHLVDKAVHSLNNTPFVKTAVEDPDSITGPEKSRLRGPFTPHNIFRGNTPGENVGPYISQFLLIGNTGLGQVADIDDGLIQYGAMRMDQRVRTAEPGRDYMTTWESFLDVQNGADVRGRDTFLSGGEAYRFITTPRDLATYVHFDALYQAYLNACIIMLGLGVPFDAGIPYQRDDDIDKQQAFAHWGGPHILTLVTEVATRALKAVRFQKFNTHRRLRPEAIGGLIERYHHDPDNALFAGVKPLYTWLDEELMELVAAHNARQNALSDFGKPRADDYCPTGCAETRLMPMAFPEGSPMHPAYGAGHATVAGACVTILKAFFDHTYTLPFMFEASRNGRKLRNVVGCDATLTVEGELNKLCANISIGRNWGGVHYFTDYRESIALGEEIALGILREQRDMYPEKYTMTVPLFNGDEVTICN